MIAQARELFNKAQLDKCNGISSKGKQLGEMIKENEAKVDEINKSIDEARKRGETLNNEIKALQSSLVAIPIVAATTIMPESIPEWVEKQEEIKELEAMISTDSSCVDTTDLQNQKASCNKKRDELVARLSNRVVIKRCEDEINNLQERGKELAQQIADAEREEYTISQFTKTKIEECEKRINSMFKVVAFRLFDYTNDGNPVETCIPTIGGVPYGSANTASKLNAGLDIINTLCKFYGVCAPIFIDNRESVNEIVPTDSQIINLVVNKDNFLTIK